MLAALILSAGLICPRSDNAALTGLWESSSTSRGGIGHTIEFRSDGTFVEAVTVIVDMRYRLEGDRLFVDASDSSESDAGDPTIVKIKAKTLVATGPDGSVVEKERLGPDTKSKSGLVGAWRYRHYTGGIAFERYTPDGQLLFRLPMASSVGCFVTRGPEITLAQPNHPENLFRYELSGPHLLLTDSAGKAMNYRKDPNGPWYDREHLDYKPPK
jgi:hypothetical protein